MILSRGSKFLLIGDSITDAGRKQPVGEGLFGALGVGYVQVMDAMLQVGYPELGIRTINMGCSGHTVRDLAARWTRDVLDLKPDWVAIMIGVNDVWRQFDCPVMDAIQVLPDEYRTTLDELVARTVPVVEGVLLATPFYIEPRKDDAMRARMDEYGAIVKEIGSTYGLRVVDVQAAFAPILEHVYPAAIAWDRVHPTAVGVAAIAKAFLNELDFDWSRLK